MFSHGLDMFCYIELPVHIQNEEEMLSVFSTALALDGANYSIKLNFVLINCIAPFVQTRLQCTNKKIQILHFLHQSSALFLKVAHGFKVSY